MPTNIEWCDETWNPATGCSKISTGCKNCYAERTAKNRLAGRWGYPADNPFSVTLHPGRLTDPEKWKSPRRIFVCSMGDLFHDQVPEDFISNVFTVAERLPRHTFMFLTKRPERMARSVMSKYHGRRTPENFWFGVTAENQEQANIRVPMLLQVPASVRFVSVEPMLGPVDLKNLNIGNVRSGRRIDLDCLDMTYQSIHLVICGGETGPGHRPMAAMWARDLLQQCHESDVAFFFKQMAGKIDTPAGLNIRELPGCDQDDTRMAANGG